MTTALLCVGSLLLAGGCRGAAEAPAAAQPKVAATKSAPVPASNSLIGEPARDFTLKDLGGKTWRLSSLRGQSMVVLEFASTSCHCAQLAVIDLDRVREKYASRGVQALAIGFEEQPLRPPAEFLKEAGLKVPFLIDPGRKTAGAYKVRWPPTVVIIDRAGIVRWICDRFSRDVADKVSAELSRMLAADDAWNADSEYGRLYASGKPTTLTGTVAVVERCTPLEGMSPGVAVTVNEGSRARRVHLGPAWYVESRAVKIRAKDKITVSGVSVRLNGKPVVLAREVRRGKDVLALRSARGEPRWKPKSG
jgi:peroxiredoxin